MFTYSYIQRHTYTERNKCIILKCSIIRTAKSQRYEEIIVTAFEMSNHYNTWMWKISLFWKIMKSVEHKVKFCLVTCYVHLKP